RQSETWRCGNRLDGHSWTRPSPRPVKMRKRSHNSPISATRSSGPKPPRANVHCPSTREGIAIWHKPNGHSTLSHLFRFEWVVRLEHRDECGRERDLLVLEMLEQ